MDFFTHKNGELFAEDCKISQIASNVGTPFYCYSQKTIERHFRIFDDVFAGIAHTTCYAMKANPNPAIMKVLAKLGAGADIVSGGELEVAIKAGINPNKIVYSGVGKTKAEIKLALEHNILQLNIESEAELDSINEVAGELNCKARIAFRVNPDVDAQTHEKISTGKKENKFGIEWQEAVSLYHKASKMNYVDVTGIDVHIGSQLLKLEPFAEAFQKVRELVLELKQIGINIKNIDLGGGLGIHYQDGEKTPELYDYAQVIKRAIGDLGCNVILEPGRVIMGNAGILVTKVIYTKKTATKNFVIIDAAMNDLIRPALYSAFHKISLVKSPDANKPKQKCDIVGPVCESSDCFVKDYDFYDCDNDELLYISSAGAYGSAMSSTYNSRPLVPEILASGSDYSIIRRRPNYEEMHLLEEVPEWL